MVAPFVLPFTMKLWHDVAQWKKVTEFGDSLSPIVFRIRRYLALNETNRENTFSPCSLCVEYFYPFFFNIFFSVREKGKNGYLFVLPWYFGPTWFNRKRTTMPEIVYAFIYYASLLKACLITTHWDGILSDIYLTELIYIHARGTHGIESNKFLDCSCSISIVDFSLTIITMFYRTREIAIIRSWIWNVSRSNRKYSGRDLVFFFFASRSLL